MVRLSTRAKKVFLKGPELVLPHKNHFDIGHKFLLLKEEWIRKKNFEIDEPIDNT
ncbi:MAG: hypothetical protein MRQ09_00695 [Candidatus Midichloria sp.]|nr:hypothetical protein [Candidatus Midichloria sp.]